MARGPKRALDDVVITGLPVDGLAPGPGGGPLAGGLWLPRAVGFMVDDPALPVVLTIRLVAKRGRLMCSSLTVTAPDDGQQMVTGAFIRSLPIDSYIQEIRRNMLTHGSLPLLEEVGRSEDGSTVFYEPPSVEALSAQIRLERKRVPSSELLPVVAEAYRAALRDPDTSYAPTAAVARQLGYSRGHMARLVHEARSANLLGKAEPGVPGEVVKKSKTRGRKS